MLDRITTTRAAPKLLTLLLVLFLAMGAVGTATAQGAPSTGDMDAQNFLCNSDNADSAFVSFISFAMGLFFIGSFALGIVAYASDKADTAAGDFDLPIVGDGNGDKAVKAGVMLPVGVWGLTFIGDAFFGYDLSCIIPLQ